MKAITFFLMPMSDVGGELKVTVMLNDNDAYVWDNSCAAARTEIAIALMGQNLTSGYYEESGERVVLAESL